MRTRLFLFAVAAFLAPLASQGGEKVDNPFKTAQVGDFLAYKLSTSINGKDIEMSMKQTVTAKSDTEVSFKAVVSLMALALSNDTTKIDLTKPYDITAAVSQGKDKGKFEKTSEGKEKIKIGGKTYECTWIAGKAAAEAKGRKIDSDMKVWISKSVPLTGIVKMEIKSDLANVVMELSDSGSAK